MNSKAIQRGFNFIRKQKKPFKVNLVRASAQRFLQYLTRQYQSVYILRLGATPFQLGLVNSVGGIGGIVIASPTGWIADRYGIRRMFLLGTPIMALGFLLFAIAPDWTAAIPAIFLTLPALQLLNTVCPMVCGSYLKNEERATGRQLCDTLSAIPSIVAPSVAAMLIAEFGGLNTEGIRPLYFLQTIGFSLTFVWVYMLYRDTLKNHVSTASSFMKDMKEVFKRGNAVKRWVAYIFLSSTTNYISLTYLPAFVTEIKLGNEFVLGSMTAASMVPPLLLALAVGRLADTSGRKKTLYITTTLYCISILILIYAQNTTMIILSGLLQGFYMLSGVTQGAISQELVPVSLLGRWYGILNLFRGLTSIIGPIIGGLIWSTIGPNYVFFFIILIETSKNITLWLTIPETLKMKQR